MVGSRAVLNMLEPLVRRDVAAGFLVDAKREDEAQSASHMPTKHWTSASSKRSVQHSELEEEPKRVLAVHNRIREEAHPEAPTTAHGERLFQMRVTSSQW